MTDLPLLSVRELSVAYAGETGPAWAVDEMSFDIAPGEVLGLVGESGCGKSSLAKALLRVLPPPAVITGGRVEFEGRDVLGMDESELRQFRWRKASLVLQSALNALNPVLRVGEQITDVIQAHEAAGGEEARTRAAALMERVGLGADLLSCFPHQLSGGMRQRVVIAIALALRPPLLILDEPTTALDVVVQREILAELAALRVQLGFSVLFITHDLSLLLQLSHRVGVVYAGRLVEIGATDELLERPRHPYTRGLMCSFPSVTGPQSRLRGIAGFPPDLRSLPPGCRFHPRCLQVMDRCRAESPVLRKLAVHVHAACHLYPDDAAIEGQAETAALSPPPPSAPMLVETPAPPPTEDEPPILEIDSLAKDYRVGGVLRRERRRALSGVSFSLRPRQAISLVGESGSGKSTLARIIARLEPATGGRVLFRGGDVLASEPRRASLQYRRAVQLIFQDPFASLNPVHTVGYHLKRPLLRHYKTRDAADLEAKVHGLLLAVGLSPPGDFVPKYAHQLSGGQRQRVAIARALAVNPSVILADEPVSMLDVSIRIGVLNLMHRLKQERGIALLYITHDLASARYLGDRTLVMYAGQLMEGAPSDQLMERPAHPYTQLLLSAVPDPRVPLSGHAAVRAGAPSPSDRGPGCPFAPRCPEVMDVCRERDPGARALDQAHFVRCHLHG